MKAINILLKTSSIIAGLAAYADVIPAKFLPIAGLVFALSSVVKDIALKLGDYADDGTMNGSFKP